MRNDFDEWAQRFVEVLSETTVKLVRLDDTGAMPVDEASGVIVPCGGSYFLLSAAHALKEGRWLLETGLTLRRSTLMLPLNAPVWTELHHLSPDTSYSVDLDFAWCKLDLQSVSEAMRQGALDTGKQDVELPLYKGPLDSEPETDVPYGFASWRHAGFHEGIRGLERELVVELGMRFTGFDDSAQLHTFELSGVHKGHDYYRGVSGSPIADPTGRIVALVAKGDSDKNLIYGFPVARYASLIAL